ncbi:MAG: molybdate ABC transporter substrate-binding protein [Clostridia bacterium]|jgi:molybdate transport system substrate-binding protein|nr:molybdate ABC transporter substrate-binding protein [Clostridia bacterium]
MKKFLISIILISFIVSNLVLFGCAQNQNRDEPVELLVSAAASLTDALEEIKELYTEENKNITVTYNFAGSGSLQQQIEQGAPVDVFISAASRHMNDLEQKNLIMDGTRIDLLTNKLVLIVPASDFQSGDFQVLVKDEIKKIAIGEPDSVPAGKYATQVFDHFGILKDIEAKFIYGKDVRQVLTWVETNNVDAGIVYASDAVQADKIRILSEAPEGSHEPIIYPAAVIKNSRHAEQAQNFLDFLATSKAQEIFARHGFSVLID